ncbi:MAG TPA: hypothetical protein VLE27_16855, partial [Thermoanaerobaculia bacterium]|nr:hypothetical protein [Thermoanaerobaculia bacterium]
MNGSPVPPKKGLSPLAWVGIGCGALLLIGVLVMGGMAVVGGMFVKKQVEKFEDNPTMAAAELMVRANPDLELVNSDAEKNTLTIRDKKTGKTMTINAEDAKEGSWTFTDDKGETVSVNASGEGIQINNNKGEQTTFGATPGGPKNLPAWVPVYPGGTVQGTMDSTTAEGRTVIFTVATPNSMDEMASFYEGKLKDAGLTVEKNTFTADQSS